MYKLVAPDKIPLAEAVDETKLVDAFKLATALSVLCVKEQGVGLSATQVGIPLNLFVIKNSLSSENYLHGFSHWVNCRYEPVGEEVYESYEGCLSLKDASGNLKFYVVSRHKSIRVIGKQIIAKNEIVLKDVDMVVSDFAAVYAHEIDHSFGITIDKIGSPAKARN
jgi:peptide deformylase